MKLLPCILLALSANAAVLELKDEANFLYTIETLPQLHTTVINTSDKPQEVKLLKERIQMPEGWDVSICFKECLPPFLDEYVATLNPGDTVSLDVDYTINPEKTATGTAITKMTISLVADPDESYVRSYGVTYGAAQNTSDLGFAVKTPSKVAPLNVLTEHSVAVYNRSSEDKEVTITRNEFSVPADWNVTMCLDLCLPAFLTTAEWSIPASSEKVMKVDVEPKSEGTAVLQFDIAEKGGEPLQSLMLSYPTSGAETPILSAHSTAALPVQLLVQQGSMNLTMPESGFARIELYNMKGQLLQQLYAGSLEAGATLSLATSQFSASMGVLKVVQNSKSYSIPVRTLK